MKLSSNTLLVTLTTLVTSAVFGCVPIGPDPAEVMVEYDADRLQCIEEKYFLSEGENALCLQAGSYKTISTWSSMDPGYALLAETTVLSTGWIAFERLPSFQQYWVGNVGAHFLARKTGNATMELVFDYLETDFRTESNPMTPAPRDELKRNPNAREILPVNLEDWKAFDFFPIPPDWADAVAIHLIKKGTGTVELSRVYATIGNVDISLLEAYDNINGGCESDDDCGQALSCIAVPNGREADAVCTLCECDKETVCGVSITGNLMECVFPGIKSLGDFCAAAAECEEGVCCKGRCSTCCDDETCTGDQKCEQLATDTPHQCNPGQGTYVLGDLCYRDEDCDSSYCKGEPHTIDDSVECGGADADTEADAGDACPTARIRYGTCAELP